MRVATSTSGSGKTRSATARASCITTRGIAMKVWAGSWGYGGTGRGQPVRVLEGFRGRDTDHRHGQRGLARRPADMCEAPPLHPPVERIERMGIRVSLVRLADSVGHTGKGYPVGLLANYPQPQPSGTWRRASTSSRLIWDLWGVEMLVPILGEDCGTHPLSLPRNVKRVGPHIQPAPQGPGSTTWPMAWATS